ncbi:MAG: class B sortase, partial [Clostridiales Family XIII bacterium]|nr:class B sortase [Clostridiales Family XIII bacterium]
MSEEREVWTEEDERAERKRRRRNAGTIILIILCAAVFAFSAWQLIKYYHANNVAESGFEEIRPPAVSDEGGVQTELTYEDLLPYYKQLKAENEDFVGWLRIPDTVIDYPVMQTKPPKNPEYYIDKNFKKEYQAAGSIFASEISDVDRPSDAVILYGHHMKTGTMFGSMGDFLKQDFFDAHRDVIFDTMTGRNEYVIYGLFKTQVYTDDPAEFAYYSVSDFTTQSAFDDFMKQVDAKLQISDAAMRPMLGDKILMLSTCEYSQENGRLVIVAVRR